MTTTFGQQFGDNAKIYAKARKAYPVEVFDLLKQYINSQDRVLDLGCGTGIATHQLLTAGLNNLLGCDIDIKMLQQAKSFLTHLLFVNAASQFLPFGTSTFKAITAFACFHWFCEEESILEIKRILQPSGLFCVVNRDDHSGFRRHYNQFLQTLAGRKLPEGKTHYDPLSALTAQNFKILANTTWTMTEYYTATEALAYCQTLSNWLCLSKVEQQQFLPALKQFLDNQLIDNILRREVTINCIVAQLCST